MTWDHEAPAADFPIRAGEPIRWLAVWPDGGKWHTAVFDDHARAEGYAARNHGRVLPLVVPAEALTPAQSTS